MRNTILKRMMIYVWLVTVVLSPLAVPGTTHAASSSNLALNPSRSACPSPQITALATLAQETPWEAVDGQFSYLNSPHNRWTDWGTGPATNWLTIDFCAATTFNQVKLYIYDDHGGVQPPSSYKIQYLNGTTWTDVTHSTSSPATPAAQLNTVTFDTVTANQVRIVLTHGSDYVGLTEVEVYLDADVAVSKAIISLIDLLPAPGSLDVSNLAMISAIRKAYDNLTATQKNLITNLSKLTDAEAASVSFLYQDVQVQPATSNAAGDKVTVKLDSVLDVTYSMQASSFQIAVSGINTSITSAVYDPSDPTYKTVQLTLPSAALFNAASATFSIQNGAFRLSNQAYNKAISSVNIDTPVSSVISVINQLPASAAVTISNQTAIAAARAAYNKLTSSQQAQVTNLALLTAAEAALAAWYEHIPVASAFSVASGSTLTVKLNSVIDATYAIQGSQFQLVADGTPLTVVGAVYDITDASLRTIKLTLASNVPSQASTVTLTIGSGAFKTVQGKFNQQVNVFPVVTFNKLDLNQDHWFAVDDVTQIIGSSTRQLDVNQDGQFTSEDIVSILGQLSKRMTP